MSAKPFTLSGLDHVVLRVPDMDVALRFYRDILGASEERRLEHAGMVQLRAGASLIDLVDLRSGWLAKAGARPFDPQTLNVDHICLRVEPFDEAAIEAYLAKRGIGVTERGTRYGAEGQGPSLYCMDPFGTTVELKGPADPVEAEGPVLKTARLALRPTRLADAEALLPAFADGETMRYWAHGPIRTLAEMKAIIARNLPPQNAAESSFAVTLDGQVAGCVNFYNERHAMCGLGYILRKEAWGQGIAAEAVEAALAHGFTRLKLKRIWLEIDPLNAASVRVAEKCGFEREGVARRSFFLDGQYHDSVFYAYLAEDWLRTRGAGAPSGR